MPLGTIDRTPPPFFRQGPSALTMLLFFSALALMLVFEGIMPFLNPQHFRRGLLLAAGYEVHAYPSAGDFLVSADQQPSGCLLLDLHMPGPSGLELQDEQIFVWTHQLVAGHTLKHLAAACALIPLALSLTDCGRMPSEQALTRNAI